MGCLLKQGGGLYARLRIGAVLLAAGQGSRMGGVAKSLIRLQGVPLIKRQLIALSGAGVDEVVVVTGYARDAVEASIASFPVTLAHNPDFALGQQSSVRCGLNALRGNFDAVLVALADQPLLGAADLTELIAAFKKRASGHVLVWGRLRGVAHAGVSGDRTARIVALHLRPLQLRIADAVARGPADAPADGQAEEAQLVNGEIQIEPAHPGWPLPE